MKVSNVEAKRGDAVLRLNVGLGRHPTLVECGAAGRGRGIGLDGVFREGGMPNTPDERARFEAYMRGHCWDFGGYDSTNECYDTTCARMLYGVWRDRGALPTTVVPNAKLTGWPETKEEKYEHT